MYVKINKISIQTINTRVKYLVHNFLVINLYLIIPGKVISFIQLTLLIHGSAIDDQHDYDLSLLQKHITSN